MRLKKHRCSIRLVAGTALLSIGLLWMPFQATAADLTSLKQQYAALQQQQQQLQTQLQDQNSQVQTEQARQNAIGSEVALTQKQLAVLQSQVDSTNTQISNKEKEIAAAQQQIDQDYTLLKQRLRAMYVSGDDSFLIVLLNSNGVSDFLNRVEIVKAVSDHDNRIIDELRAEQAQLDADKKVLDQAQQELLQEQGTMAAKQDILNAQLAQQTQTVAQVQANASDTQQSISAVTQQAAKTDAQINTEIAAEAAAAKKAAAQKAAQQTATQSAASVPSHSGGSSGSTQAGTGSTSSASQSGSGTASGPVATASPGGFGTAAYVINYAETFVGYPYVFGTAGPDTFDCSGYVQWVFAKAAGIGLTHSAAEQSQSSLGTSVSRNDLQPGDLVFFNVDGSGIDHVGIYIGGGRMVNAENSSVGVTYDSVTSSYWSSRFACARRFLN